MFKPLNKTILFIIPKIMMPKHMNPNMRFRKN